MWNKPLDFCGYLSLLWIGMEASQAAEQSTDLEDYGEWSKRTELPTTDLPYHLLAPSGLLCLATLESSSS
jgi:hypothetical protein